MTTPESPARKTPSGLAVFALTTLAISNLVGRKRTSPTSTRARAIDHGVGDPKTSDTKGGGGAAVAGGDAVPVDHAAGLVGIATSIFDRFSRDNAMLTAAGIASISCCRFSPGSPPLCRSMAWSATPPRSAGR